MLIFGWSVQEKNHNILKAAYETLKARVESEERRWDTTFGKPGERAICEDTPLKYISVYTKQDNSARFFGIPSTQDYCDMICQGNPGYPSSTHPIEVQFQHDPSNNTYQAVVFNEYGGKKFTFGEENYSQEIWTYNHISSIIKEYGKTYEIGDSAEDVCHSVISSALRSLGQCQE